MANFKAVPPDTASPFYEAPLTQDVVFQGRVITVRRDTARHPDGEICEREVAEHPGGVVVCPVLPDGRLILVEQWRYPLKRTLLEFPAGKLDWHDDLPEDPLAAMKRELWEETNYEADDWQALGSMYTAPGFCDERIWLFKATGLHEAAVRFEPEEHELLHLFTFAPAEVWQKIRDGEIMDAKTIALMGLCFSDAH